MKINNINMNNISTKYHFSQESNGYKNSEEKKVDDILLNNYLECLALAKAPAVNQIDTRSAVSNSITSVATIIIAHTTIIVTFIFDAKKLIIYSHLLSIYY